MPAQFPGARDSRVADVLRGQTRCRYGPPGDRPPPAGGVCRWPEEGDASFNHVPGTVKLVALGEICPALRWSFDREVGIQVAIFALGVSHQFNHFISGLFQLAIWLLAQRPGDGFQPFRHVTVLKTIP